MIFKENNNDEMMPVTESTDYEDERVQELIDNIMMDVEDSEITIDIGDFDPTDPNDTILYAEVYSGSGEYMGMWELDLEMYDDTSYASSIAAEINAVDLDDDEAFDTYGSDSDSFGMSYNRASQKDVSRWTSGNYYGENKKKKQDDEIKELKEDEDFVDDTFDLTDEALGEKIENYKGFNIYKGTDAYGEECYRCFFEDDVEPEVGYEEWEAETLDIIKEWIDSYEDFDGSEYDTESIEDDDVISW